VAAAPGPALAALAALAPEIEARFSTHAAGASLEPQHALAVVVRAAADEQPVLLAFDDAHDLDAETAGALPQLARDLVGHRALIVLGVAVGANRPPWIDQLRAHVGRELAGDVIGIGRLDHPALEALARWWLPSYSAEEIERVVRRLERDSAGVALLATAILEAVSLGFRLSPAAPAWPVERRTLVDSLPGDLPPAVIGAVCLRYRQLPELSREVLGAAASLEERFTVDSLMRATGLAGSDVERALDRLEWDRWVVADARGYAFTAPIERAILLQEMISPGQARRFRERI
jgi:hypothetical protein